MLAYKHDVSFNDRAMYHYAAVNYGVKVVTGASWRGKVSGFIVWRENKLISSRLVTSRRKILCVSVQQFQIRVMTIHERISDTRRGKITMLFLTHQLFSAEEKKENSLKKREKLFSFWTDLFFVWFIIAWKIQKNLWAVVRISQALLKENSWKINWKISKI